MVSRQAEPIRGRWFSRPDAINFGARRTMMVFWVVLTLVFRSEIVAAEPKLSARPPLPIGQVVEDTLAPDETAYYPLRLEAGSFLRVTGFIRDMVVALRLIGPDQKLLHGGDQRTLLWVTEGAGDYGIKVVGLARRRVPLRYAIMLQELRSAEPLDEKRLAAQRLNDEGYQKYNGGSNELKREAIQIYEQARALWHELGEGAGEAAALLSIATVEHSLGELERARAHFDEARSIAQKVGDRFLEAWAINNQAVILSESGHRQEAIDSKHQALAIFRAIGDRGNENRALGNLAGDYAQLGEYERAVELLEPALRYKRETGDDRGEATQLSNLAEILGRLGRLPQALEYAQSAVALSRRERLHSEEAFALAKLGFIQHRMEKFQEAMATYDEALAAWQKLGNHWQEGLTRIGLAKACVASGQVARGRELLDQALLELRASGDSWGECVALAELARVEQTLGMWPRRKDISMPRSKFTRVLVASCSETTGAARSARRGAGFTSLQ